MITVLGARGFIGSHLVAHLGRCGLAYRAPERGTPLEGCELGHVIDCVGITGDHVDRPLEIIEAHVGRVAALLRSASFDSFLYLSSTRLYLHASGPAREEDALLFDPADAGYLYNLSKAAGEALVLSLGEKGRIVRLATIYGPGQRHTFLATILEEAKAQGVIPLRSALESQRDYLSVEDAVGLIVKIALGGRHRLYNVASGVEVAHAQIVDLLAKLCGWRVEVAADALVVRPPPIDISRIRDEFDFRPRNLFDILPTLVAA